MVRKPKWSYMGNYCSFDVFRDCIKYIMTKNARLCTNIFDMCILDKWTLSCNNANMMYELAPVIGQMVTMMIKKE